jgi:predicted nicotinamide N-methyase
LGAGTGLCGIACALLGAHITITDLEVRLCALYEINDRAVRISEMLCVGLAHAQPVVGLMSRNITLNLGTQSNAKAMAHGWGTVPDDALGAPFDVIVMSDVVYDPVLYQPLVDSMVALSHPQTLVLMSHRQRNPDNAIFFGLVRKHFNVVEVACGQVGDGKGYRSSGSGEAGETTAGEATEAASSSSRTCSDVHVYEMTLLTKAVA